MLVSTLVFNHYSLSGFFNKIGSKICMSIVFPMQRRKGGFTKVSGALKKSEIHFF